MTSPDDPSASNTPPSPPPPPPGYGTQPPTGYGPPTTPAGNVSARGFFASLFDFQFESFATPKIVKFVYALTMIIVGLWFVGAVIAGFAAGAGYGILFLIFGAIGAVVFLAFIRMTLEIYYSIVRMSEDVHRRLPGV
jgi:hypothetical protein